MKRIIALQGDKDTGKSLTIGILFDNMRNNGYVVVQDKKRKSSHDFFVILKKHGKKIGLSTYGDFKRMIIVKVELFIGLDCEIIVCACHRIGKTVEAIKNVKGCDAEFIPKSVAQKPEEREGLNRKDAGILFSKIESLLP